MNLANEPRAESLCSSEEARVAVGTALSLLELAGQVLEKLPSPDAALDAGDPVLFRYLRAAEASLGWIVGQSEEDCIDAPGPSSALGDGQRIYWWTDEETAASFRAARDRSEAE